MIAQDLAARLRLLAEAALFRSLQTAPTAHAASAPQALPDAAPSAAERAGAHPPAPALAASTPGSPATTRISATAHLIDTLLALDARGKPLPLNSAQALASTAPTPQNGGTQRLAIGLRNAFERSGLFYEAHQARWMAGRLPLAQLLQEPQAKVGEQAGWRAPAAPPQASRSAIGPRSVSEPTSTLPKDEGALAGNRLPLRGARPTPPGPDITARPRPGPQAPALHASTPDAAPRPPAVPAPDQFASRTTAPRVDDVRRHATLAAEAAAGSGPPSSADNMREIPSSIAAGARPQQAASTSAVQAQLGLPARDGPSDDPVPQEASARPPRPTSDRPMHFGGSLSGAFTRILLDSGYTAHCVDAAGSPSRDAPSSAAAMPAARAPLPLPERLIPIVQQQLEALAGQQYPVQFSPWPGQSVDWFIKAPGQREDAPSRQTADEEAPEWRSRVCLTLPSLGQLEIDLHYRSGAFSITLHACSDAAHSRLRQNLTGLLAVMSDANLKISNLNIAQEELSPVE